MIGLKTFALSLTIGFFAASAYGAEALQSSQLTSAAKAVGAGVTGTLNVGDYVWIAGLCKRIGEDLQLELVPLEDALGGGTCTKLNDYALVEKAYAKLIEEQAEKAKKMYEESSAIEVGLKYSKDGAILMGSSTQEKRFGDHLCRKSHAVVPNPINHFSCYTRMADIDASKEYDAIEGDEQRVDFSAPGNPFYMGGGKTLTTEKRTANVICRKTIGAILPIGSKPGPYYSCFKAD